MTRIELLPAQFWALTPAEFGDLLQAYRSRRNFDAMQRAFEVYMQVVPHIGAESSVSPHSIFRMFPGAFPEDLDDGKVDTATHAPEARVPRPEGMTDEQYEEYVRRRSIPRINRLGKQK